jgi:hypothetical protein
MRGPADALGTVSQTLLKRFWVFDPDKSVEDRFQKDARGSCIAEVYVLSKGVS